jgi:DHA1 family tetracycline resistance protein-like MFS transporter
MSNRFLFLLVTAFLDAIGLGIIFPIGPALIAKFESDPQVATYLYGLFISLYALMQFLSSPVLGGLSDLYGRRIVLLTGLAGAAIDYLVMAYAGSLPILFIGRIISGMTGGTITVATAYITDVTTEAERAGRFGQLNAAFGLGFIIGPLLGGYLGKFSHELPFFVAAGLNGVNFLYGFFVLPESLSKENRRKFTRAALSPFKSIGWVLGRKVLVPLVAAYFFLNMCGHFVGTMWAIYNRDKFGWDTDLIGISLSAFGISMAVAQSIMPPKFIKWFGERGSVTFGLLGMSVTYFALGMATAGWMVFALTPVIAFFEASIPALQNLITARVEQSRQGELQGTLVGMMSLAGIFAPLVATAVYTPHFRGAPFALGAVILASLTFLIHYDKRNDAPAAASPAA